MTTNAPSLHHADQEVKSELESILCIPFPPLDEINEKTVGAGFQVDETKTRIIGISLANCGLGMVPKSISKLEALKFLNLNGNNLNSVYILTLKGLPGLTHLYLADNPSLERRSDLSYRVTEDHLHFYLGHHLTHPLARSLIHKDTIKTIIVPAEEEELVNISKFLKSTKSLVRTELEALFDQSPENPTAEAKEIIYSLYNQIEGAVIEKNTLDKALWFFQTEPLLVLKAVTARLFREITKNFVDLSKLAPFNSEIQKIAEQETNNLIAEHLGETLRWTAAYSCPNLELPLKITPDSQNIPKIINKFLKFLTDATKMREEDLVHFELNPRRKIPVFERFRSDPPDGIELHCYIIDLFHSLNTYLTDDTIKQQICSQLLKLCFHHSQLRDLAENALDALERPIFEKVRVIRILEDAIHEPLHLIEDIENLSGGENAIEIRGTQIYAIRIVNSELPILPEIGALTELEYLDLRKLALMKLDKSIGKLTILKYLWLSQNNLEELPNELCELKSLQLLDLSDNVLTKLPESFGNLTTLTELRLQYNELTALPDSFGNLPNLQKLSLCNNKLADKPESVPKSFSQLKCLQDLDLSNNALTSLPESVYNLRTLQKLNLRWNRLSELSESFGKLELLNKLYLENNQLNGLHDSFSQLKNLQVLELSYNDLISVPDTFNQLQKLEVLELQHNKAFSSLPESFKELKNLKTLDLSYTSLALLINAIKMKEEDPTDHKLNPRLKISVFERFGSEPPDGIELSQYIINLFHSLNLYLSDEATNQWTYSQLSCLGSRYSDLRELVEIAQNILKPKV